MTVLALLLYTIAGVLSQEASYHHIGLKGPVIIDTDIGADIDDSYAVALSVALNWDVKMIITDTFDTVAKAQGLAKYLTLYNRTKIPIGIGPQITKHSHDALYPWSKDFSLTQYEKNGGILFRDGLKKFVEILETSPEPVTILAIAPPVNLAILVDRYPDLLAKKVKHVYAMFGSLYECYGWKSGQCREANAASNVTASQTFLRGPWNITIAPLDVAQPVLNGSNWHRMRAVNNSEHVMVNAILTTWCIMHPDGSCPYGSDFLYDPTNWYLSFMKQTGFSIKRMKIAVNATGFTNPSPTGREIGVALEWLPGVEANFKKLVADTLINYQP